MNIVKLSLCVIVPVFLVAAARGADTATVTGKIVLDGTAPKMKRIKVDADPKCAEMHADAPLTSEEVVPNDNGTLRWVFVYVKTGLEGKTFETPSEPVVLDQKGCHYAPHVFGMMAKQKLMIKNDDDTLHNIHAMPTANKEFNIGQPNQGMETARTFAQPEVMVHFKCDVHPWMSAYVGVLPHPFYSVSGEDGTFTIKGLPPGDYTIEAWHEKYGTQTQTVKVAAGETKTVDFKFKAGE